MKELNNMYIPSVTEKTSNGERTSDLFSRLLKDRVIFIMGVFDDNLANSTVAQLLWLEANDSTSDINMYINSPGGSVTSMFAIYDVMEYVKPDIATIGYGQCMSAGSFLLAAGTKGKRSILNNTEAMLHELSGSTQGKFNDMKIDFEHSQKLYDKMAKNYVSFTGQKLAKIRKDMERDHYLTAQEALDYGLVDNIYEKR